VVVGCSASGSDAALDDDTNATSPMPTADPPHAALPPSTSSSSGSSGAVDDAGKPTDGGKEAAAVDAGPPPPTPGTPCPTVDAIQQKSCGACGKQSAICQPDKKWSDYSTCEGELVGGCIPGTVVTTPCGNCGTSTSTCSMFCAMSTAACVQPAGSCVPGSVDLVNAGCGVDTFRVRSCSPTCTYGNFGATCGPPPDTIEIGPSLNSVSSTIAILTQDQTLSKITGSCPNATLTPTIMTSYAYVQVHNPLTHAAVVAIYNSLPPGGVSFKTALVAYDAVIAPTDDTARKACLGIALYGTTALTGDAKYASLDQSRAITIQPGATVSVYVGAYYAFDPTKPGDSTGKVMLNAKTMSLL
jgi:hypothetical protein